MRLRLAGLVQPATAARAAGALLAVGAVGLAGLGRPAAAVVLGAAGLGLALLVTERSRNVPSAGLDTSAALAADLGLEGHGHHVQVGGPEGAVRLFIPADAQAAGTIPTLSAGRALHRAGPAHLGLSLVPPGAELEEAWQERNGLPEGGGGAALLHHARLALPALDAGRDVHVLEGRQGRVRVTYRRAAYAAACRRARDRWAPWHLQGCCPACSLVAMLAARAHGAPVRWVANEASGDTVTLDLEVVPSSPAP